MGHLGSTSAAMRTAPGSNSSKQPELLCRQVSLIRKGDAGEVAARPVEAGDKSRLDRIGPIFEYDRESTWPLWPRGPHTGVPPPITDT